MRARALLLALLGIEIAGAANTAPLELESKIPLGDVRGRIDHLAIDLKRQRLYVAELGNDSVGVVDLKQRKLLRTLTGLKAPQGMGYVPSTDTLYVANAGDGSVRLFQGEELAPIGQIALGDDADNIRVDDAAHRVFVGYGDGALAVIDTASRRKIADIALKAHPESFQLERSDQHIFVNVPDAHEIAALDRVTNKQVAGWPQQRILSVFRHPARVGVFRTKDGQLLATVNTCGDADDVFLDEKRNRLYVSCGEGFVDILASQGEGYVSIGRIPTAAGARTALFVLEMDRLMLAVRATAVSPASVWVLRPTS